MGKILRDNIVKFKCKQIAKILNKYKKKQKPFHT